MQFWQEEVKINCSKVKKKSRNFGWDNIIYMINYLLKSDKRAENKMSFEFPSLREKRGGVKIKITYCYNKIINRTEKTWQFLTF